MRRAKKMRQHVEKREGICRTKKLVVLGRGDESATRQTLARSARGAAAEAAAVIGASESPRRRSCSNCSCDRRRPSPSGWSTHRSIAGTARRRTRPRAGRAASARRSAVPPSPPGWPRAADHRRLKQTAQRPRRDEEVSIITVHHLRLSSVDRPGRVALVRRRPNKADAQTQLRWRTRFVRQMPRPDATARRNYPNSASRCRAQQGVESGTIGGTPEL